MNTSSTNPISQRPPTIAERLARLAREADVSPEELLTISFLDLAMRIARRRAIAARDTLPAIDVQADALDEVAAAQ